MKTFGSPPTDDFFDVWVDRGGYSVLTDENYRTILRLSPLLSSPRKTVLDVGCGPGSVSLIVKSMGHRVIGLDMSRKALERAQAAQAVDEIRVGDIAHSDLCTGSVDVVLCFSVLLYVMDLGPTLQEIHRILQPGGEVLIFDHYAGNPYTWLHFHRPSWVDRLLDGQSNLARRPLSPHLLRQTGQGLFNFDEPRYFNYFGIHSNWTVNAIHSAARWWFEQARRWTDAPWTGRFIGITGHKTGSSA